MRKTAAQRKQDERKRTKKILASGGFNSSEAVISAIKKLDPEKREIVFAILRSVKIY